MDSAVEDMLTTIDDKLKQFEMKIWNLIDDKFNLNAQVSSVKNICFLSNKSQECMKLSQSTLKHRNEKEKTTKEIHVSLRKTGKFSELQNRLHLYEMYLWSLLDENQTIASIIQGMRDENSRIKIEANNDVHLKSSLVQTTTKIIDDNSENNIEEEQQIRSKLQLDSEKQFVCDICNRRYSRKDRIQQHMYQRHMKRDSPYMCSTCGQTFVNQSRFKYHKLTHKEPQYPCEICSRKFYVLSAVKMHKRVHFDATTARFPCEICGKQLRTQYILKTHMEIHNVKKLTYTCDLCNKNFASAASLHRHMRTHTGERPFVCPICGKGISHGPDLKVHMRVHTGEKPYACKECDRRFADKRNMRKHERVHQKSRDTK